MTQIDFYLIPGATTQAKQLFACRLLTKAYQQQKTVLVLLGSNTEASQFEEVLWTFDEESFIPHNIINRQPVTAITISDHVSQPFSYDILFNLSAINIEAFGSIPRLIEIITQDNDDKAAGRCKYKNYQALGFEPNTHKL